MPFIRIAASAATYLVLFAGTTQAQDLQNWCQDAARSMCGSHDISLAECMNHDDIWSRVPNECIGDLQTMIEMEREYAEEQQHSPSAISGLSYGGILRGGPGIQHRRLGSLRESDWLEILDDTGVWYEGYQWFRVSTSIGIGYHWGGIFCTQGASLVEGVFSSCN